MNADSAGQRAEGFFGETAAGAGNAYWLIRDLNCAGVEASAQMDGAILVVSAADGML